VLRYENGAPHVLFTARGVDQAIERLKEELNARVRGDRLHVAIAHAGDIAQVEPLRVWVEAAWSPVELYVLDIPPIIAVYSGPGALGIAVYPENDESHSADASGTT
jgi:fatty acid-binding protein DegV